MNKHMKPSAMDVAMAQIAELGNAAQARIDRNNADARLTFIRREIAANDTEITMGGMAGGMQMFLNILSSRSVRRIRACALFRARERQLDGQHMAARTELFKAATVRRNEKAFFEVEQERVAS